MRLRLFLCLGLFGCATQQNPSISASSETRAPKAEEQSTANSRFLRRDATYADLVRTIGVLEPTSPEGEHCLLARGHDEYRLSADFASAIYPLPEAPEDLDQLINATPYVRVLSRWGQHGKRGAQLTLATLTDVPATRDALSIILTDQGVYVRPSDLEHNTRIDAVRDAELFAVLEEAGAVGPTTALAVSAEAAVSTTRIYQVLSVLAEHNAGPVTLALALPAGIKVAEPADRTSAPELCPDGLPESDAPEGEIDFELIHRAIFPLREQASACLARADARGAAGGKLSIALRIGPDGRVRNACVEANETQDDALSSCVLEVMRTLSLPAPSPSGEVDLSLPLVLRQINTPAQAPVCRPTE